MDIQQWNKINPIFEGSLDPVYKDLAHCDVYYIAYQGFAIINHTPQYSLYQRMGIAEIQDVFVMPQYRRQGVATRLIEFCEKNVTGTMVGISVSVSPQFGSAQRLYAKMGYEPDGNGVTYERSPIAHGTMAKVDDQLCLMLIKDLNK